MLFLMKTQCLLSWELLSMNNTTITYKDKFSYLNKIYNKIEGDRHCFEQLRSTSKGNLWTAENDYFKVEKELHACQELMQSYLKDTHEYILLSVSEKETIEKLTASKNHLIEMEKIVESVSQQLDLVKQDAAVIRAMMNREKER